MANESQKKQHSYRLWSHDFLRDSKKIAEKLFFIEKYQ